MAEKRKRQLAAIMFTDIVGYSAMMNTNEQEGIKKANHYRQVLTKQVSKHSGEIVQHYGDGSLSIFSSSVEAVNCAKNIQIKFRNEPKVPLRIGIHLGDIVLDGEDIYGDGVNIASRVESMGNTGSVLMTERIFHDLKSHPDLALSSLGRFQFKNIANPLEVFALANKGFPIPDKNKISGKLESASLTNPSHRNLWLSIVGVIALLIGWYLWNHFSNTLKTTPSETKERIGIAVLPIENLSKTKENKVICNGLMQEIIARISAVKDFRVLPRTSVLQVANNNLSIPEIAKELGVQYILEGSLQSSNDQIRINANLIKANDNEVVWNQNFEGDYTQIFNFQLAIAMSVSKQLGITLSPLQSDIVTRQPAKNRLAYEKYLNGLEQQNNFEEQKDTRYLQKAKLLFLDATKVDDKFAEAYVQLSQVFYDLDKGEGLLLDSSIYYANKAIEINPNLSQAYLYKGRANFMSGSKNQAEKELLKSYELNPSSDEVCTQLKFYYLFINQYDKAYHYAQEALLLNPKNVVNYSGLAQIYGRVGMEKEAYDILSKGRMRFGENNNHLTGRLGWLDYTFKNDASLLIEFFSKLHEENKADWFFTLYLGDFYSRTGQYKKANEYFNPCYNTSPPCNYPWEIMRIKYAYTLSKLGKKELIKKYIDDVLFRRTKFLQPESSFYHFNFQALAGAHALVGNADSTIYWLQKWKKSYGNFDLNLLKKDSLFVPIWNTSKGQEFLQKEQAKIDSMAANIRMMRIKG